jgi:hypothetical protein
MKTDIYMYVTSSEPISTAYFVNLSNQSVSVCVCLLSFLGKGCVKYDPPFGATQRLGKHVPAGTNTRKNIKIVLRPCMCMPLFLLGKNRQRHSCFKFHNNTVSYFPALRVVDNEKCILLELRAGRHLEVQCPVTDCCPRQELQLV